MNLLLLEARELDGGRARLADRRAVHVREVLRAAVGAKVRCGVIGGDVGTAQVIADDGTAIDLEVALERPSPPPMPVDLILAMPRPKVLSRALETAAAFAVRRVDIVNSWRVDKAYLDSPRLEAADIDEHLRLGAEQGVTTHLPVVEVHRRLMPFLDQRHPAGAGGLKLCCHARDAVPIETAWRGEALPATIALGPEGGWIEREVATFAARGFSVVSLGAPVLRVEVALAAVLGQITLLLRALA